MNFDRYLESFDDGAGGKEQIALAVYYLEESKGQRTVSQSDVRSLIRQSRSTISASGTSQYFTRLVDAKWITEAGADGYRLTGSGREEVEALLDDDALEDTRQEDDVFLDTENFEDEERYGQLVEDINRCYQHRIYDATMVLTRKFFEDLVFQILQTQYAGEDNQMFYDQENNRPYSFDELLTNLSEAVPVLRRYAPELDTELVHDLRELKDEGNESAHAIRVSFTDGEVESWSTDVTRMAELLHDVLRGARIADQE